MHNRLRPRTIGLLVAGTGFALGLGGTALWSADDLRSSVASLHELHRLPTLEPMRALPRTEMALAMLEASSLLREQRPYAAWSLLREYTEGPDAVSPSLVLLAARAAGEWGGWSHVRELLHGAQWLSSADDAEGWFLLGRAEEELENWGDAATAYRRYLEESRAGRHGVAAARLGRVLRAAGDAPSAATAFAAAADRLPTIGDWLRALEAEQRAAAGAMDVGGPAVAADPSTVAAPARVRHVRAEVQRHLEAGDTARALRRLDWETRVLSAQQADGEAGELVLQTAEILQALRRTGEARELLRAAALNRALPGAVRRRGAERMGELPQRSAAEELARADAYEAAGEPGLAARSLRAARAAGASDDAAFRVRLARLLYDARDYGPARVAFESAAELLTDRDRRAEAELYAARALYRTVSEAEGRDQLQSIAKDWSGTPAAGTALFLLGDLSSSLESAVSYYRKAAEVESSPDAREALFRLGDRYLRLDQPRAATEVWEEYVRRYPSGEETARVAYTAGTLHERAGRRDAARRMYNAAIAADPLSYYSMLAGNRLGVNPLERIRSEPDPWVGLAADPLQAASALERLDLLERAGLAEEREEELSAVLRRFDNRPLALLVLAEGLRDRGEVLHGIRLGRRLARERGGEWDRRLLRLVFPLPYRNVLEHAAQRGGVDPMLFAGLVRQESAFRPAVRSWVGATGLSQIMPSTGRWLASSMEIPRYEERLLEVPEVNLRMGAAYLGDLVDRYDGAYDLALAGYNAGPGRADRWRRTLDYAEGAEAFRERIPFDETRHYVKVVLRNAQVYDYLYGDPRPAGLVRTE